MSPLDPRRRLFRLPWQSRAQVEADVADEFAFHIRSRADELAASGIPAAEARRRAESEFGDAPKASAYCRDLGHERVRTSRRAEGLGELRLDLVYLFRSLLRRPGPSLAIVLMLGIALGVNVLTFTLANELLFRRLPVADPGSLVLVHGLDRQTKAGIETSIPDFRDLRDRAGGIIGLAGFNGRTLGLGADAGGTTRVVPAQIVSSNFFDVLGLVPAAGRFFVRAEDDRGGEPAAVISYALWQERFHGAEVIGTSARVNGVPFRIVGVSPRGFSGPFTGFRFDLFVPLGAAPTLDHTVDLEERSAGFLELFGRLRPGESAQVAGDRLTKVAADLNGLVPANRDRVLTTAAMTGLDTDLEEGVKVVVALVIALAGLGLLVASLNAGGLLLARGMLRRKEFAVRLALGAGRSRLVRLQLLEAGMLVALAAGVGLAVMVILRRGLGLLLPSLPLKLVLALPMDGRVAGFLMLLLVGTAMATGVAPAFATTRGDVAFQLRGGITVGKVDSRLRRLFLTAQVAVTFALLVGAGLLVRALASGRPADQDRTASVVTVPLDLTFADYNADSGRRFYQNLLQRVRAIPGVVTAAYAARLPFGFGAPVAMVAVPGVDPPKGQTGFRIEMNRVSAGWNEAVELPVSKGRTFAASDRPDGPAVALVNQAMASRFWPRGDPVHRTMTVNDRVTEIVGVLDDGRFATPGRLDIARVYLASDQGYSPRAVLLVRAATDDRRLAEALVAALRQTDPDLPINSVGTLAANLSIAYLPQRLLGGATAGIAVLTLVLASFGLYGLLAFWVATRQSEIGIRSALGARPAAIARLAIRQGLGPTTLGVAAGVVLSVGLGLLLRGFLLGVSPVDPAAYLVAALVFYAVATAACLIPAGRAARVSPMVALRGG